MPDLCMLGDLQILQDSPAGDNAVMKVLYTEAFQTLHLEMVKQFLHSCLFGEYPVFQEEVKEAVTEKTLEVSFPATFYQHLFRLEVVQQLLHIVVGTLTGKKLSRRDI